MMFPVVIKTPVHVEPHTSLYYEIAANGAFQVRDTAIYRAVTRAVGAIPGLVPEAEHLRLKCPRLPRSEIEDVLAFFAEVYRRYRSEAVVLLFYSPERRTFRVVAPPQTLSGWRDSTGRWVAALSVRYEAIERPPAFVLLGTIHSHADLPAYASHVDHEDERYEDGLHLVFGHFHEREPSVAASFVANGVRFALDPADVLEPYRGPARSPRSDWMAQLRLEQDSSSATCTGSLAAALPPSAARPATAPPLHGSSKENTDGHTGRRRGG